MYDVKKCTDALMLRRQIWDCYVEKWDCITTVLRTVYVIRLISTRFAPILFYTRYDKVLK